MADLQAWAEGFIIMGGAAEWEAAAFNWDKLAGGIGADMTHGHTNNAQGGTISHDSALSNVSADDHHNEIHVVNSTGSHAEAGLTAGHVLRATGVDTFAFAALAAGDLPTAIDAANIADGSVSNAEFQYLDGMDQGVATGDSPTFAGLTIGTAGNILPTDAFGQDLGDATHWWSLYTRDIHYCGATGENWINFPIALDEALKWREATGMNYMAIVSANAQRMVIINPDNGDIDFIVGAIGAGTGLQVRGSDGQITLGVLTQGVVSSDAGGVLSVTAGSAIVGSGAVNRVAYWSAANTLASDTGMTYNAATDTLSLANSLTFTGATGVNDITFPDALANALHLIDDTTGLEFMRIVTTAASQAVVFNEGGADIDFRIEAVGIPGAFRVDGASGALGVHQAPNAVVGLWLGVAASDGFDFGCIGRVSADNAGADAGAYYGYLGGVTITGAGNLTHAAVGQTALIGQISHKSASVVARTTALVADTRFEGVGATGSITAGRGLWIKNPQNTGGATGTMGTFEGIYIAAITFATTNYAIYSAGGNSYHAGRFAFGGTVTPLAQLHVDQSINDAAIPVAIFDQADVDQDMFEFITTIGVGNAIEAVGGKTLTTTHFVKVTLPGALIRYFPVGTIA